MAASHSEFPSSSGGSPRVPTQPIPITGTDNVRLVTHDDDVVISFSPRSVSSINVDLSGAIHVQFEPESPIAPSDDDFADILNDAAPLTANTASDKVDVTLVDTTDETPLLDNNKLANKKQSWSSWIKKKVFLFATNALAFITALPPSLNALAAPSHQSPEMIGPEWWHSLSPLVKIHAIANSAASLAVNTIMNALFLPIAIQTLFTNVRHMTDSPSKFVKGLLSLISGLAAALAAGAIAHHAFAWLPQAIWSAAIPAALSFLAASASRYVASDRGFTKFMHQFNEDIQLQVQLNDSLAHVDLKQVELLKTKFDHSINAIRALHINHDAPLTPEQTSELTKNLAEQLDHFASLHPDFITEKTSAEYARKYAGLLFDIAFAWFILAPASFFAHLQKGKEGIDLLSMGHLSDTNIWEQRFAGLLPGLASAMLYGISALEIRETVVEVAKHLYKNPKKIPFAIALLAANGFSSGGMQSVAEGIVNKANIIGFNATDNPALSTTFVVLTALGGTITNTNSTLKKAFLSQPTPTLKTVNYDTFVNYLSKHHDHPIDRKTATHLRDLTLFATTVNTQSENQTQSLSRSTPSNWGV